MGGRGRRTDLELTDFARGRANEGRAVSVELDGKTTFLDQGTVGCGCVESRDARPPCPQSFGK